MHSQQTDLKCFQEKPVAIDTNSSWISKPWVKDEYCKKLAIEKKVKTTSPLHEPGYTAVAALQAAISAALSLRRKPFRNQCKTCLSFPAAAMLMQDTGKWHEARKSAFARGTKYFLDKQLI
jgi:hypothetical protein